MASTLSAGLTITAIVYSAMRSCGFAALKWAEDLVQETLYAAVRIFGTFRGKSSERTWLCGILKNKICDYFRKLGQEVSFTDLDLLQDEVSHKFVERGFWSHDPGRLEWKSEVEVMETKLPLSMRMKLRLHYPICASCQRY